MAERNDGLGVESRIDGAVELGRLDELGQQRGAIVEHRLEGRPYLRVAAGGDERLEQQRALVLVVRSRRDEVGSDDLQDVGGTARRTRVDENSSSSSSVVRDSMAAWSSSALPEKRP